MSLDIQTPWGAVINAVVGIIDKVIPDPAQKAQAQLAVLQMQQNGQLEQLKADVEAVPFSGRHQQNRGCIPVAV
jgi:hypothetical protein